MPAGEAEWLRFPTHPTLPENIAIAVASGADRILAHSCDAATAATLVADIPKLVTGLRPGDTIEI